LCKFLCSLAFFFSLTLLSHPESSIEKYPAEIAHSPSPLPDRVVLTWNDDPATTQAVSWRTDVSVKAGLAQLAIANANGRALKPDEFKAETSYFKSDINEAHYHSLTFKNLQPDTLYAYRVGDGVNWTEYYHFKTASSEEEPFSFIYFGDAQNEVRTHWSRVFREAFRDAPRAAFALYAGDMVNRKFSDSEWGEWHQGPDWVNGTLPVIATPGNHEYFNYDQRFNTEFYWTDKEGDDVEVTLTSMVEEENDQGKVYKMSLLASDSEKITIEFNDSGVITQTDDQIEVVTGFSKKQLLGRNLYGSPLYNRQRIPEQASLSNHWRMQFEFPVQNVPDPALAETVYYIDYQGVRFISLDSNNAKESQVEWLKKVLESNKNFWTIVTFHHPMFSPGSDRDNPEIRKLWKPILDEFKVDLILSGHDHTYARTGQIGSKKIMNIPEGYEKAYDPNIGTVNVVSVSGPKMYKITKGAFAKRMAEDTQLYQIVDIKKDSLRFRAYTATGKLYDEFLLKKRKDQPNLLIETGP
jgi:3',5'-cyclic AMP phosphodiesterase CpdA